MKKKPYKVKTIGVKEPDKPVTYDLETLRDQLKPPELRKGTARIGLREVIKKFDEKDQKRAAEFFDIDLDKPSKGDSPQGGAKPKKKV